MATVAPAAISAPAPVYPVPADLLPWQVRAVARSAEIAVSRGLRLLARGVCKIAAHRGAPVFVISSASRPGRSHRVWIERGRIHCDCEARTTGHGFTCSHAQFVRLLLVAERATPASVPPAAVAASSPDDDDPTPPPTSGGPGGAGVSRCPTCGFTAPAEEIAQLGECVNCALTRDNEERMEAEREAEWQARLAAWEAREEYSPLVCWACGESADPASAGRLGLYCRRCMRMSTAHQRAAIRDRMEARRAAEDARAAAKVATAKRVIARARTRAAGMRSEASPRAGSSTKTRAAKAPAKAQTAEQATPAKTRKPRVAKKATKATPAAE